MSHDLNGIHPGNTSATNSMLGQVVGTFLISEPPPELNDSAVALLTLTYSDELARGMGYLWAKHSGATYNAVAGAIEICTGTLVSDYSLIREPYAPGVAYNRIFMRQTGAGAILCLDSNGLVFQRKDLILNIWTNKHAECAYHRSDGLHGTGCLSIGERPIGHWGHPVRPNANHRGSWLLRWPPGRLIAIINFAFCGGRAVDYQGGKEKSQPMGWLHCCDLGKNLQIPD